ncbi:MAG: S41 family peptidase [Phototrophicaceae bacterium]|jgi:carboxyl-terminal processing protease
MKPFRNWRFGSVPFTALLVLAVFVGGFLLGRVTNVDALQINLSPEEEQEFSAFWDAYSLLREEFLDPIDPHVVAEGAITGMLDSVGDQYTGYIPSEFYTLMNEDLSGEIQGIGVVIYTIEETGEIAVANVLKDTPASRAGVEEGDIFVTVNGEEVLGNTQLELAGKVRGPRGSVVEITFRRGEEMIPLAITRDSIPIPTAEYALLEGNIGYIRLYEFNSQSRPQVDEALASFEGTELTGLILDLRGNPGGTLDSSIRISSAFLEEGAVILREEFAGGREQVFNADGSNVGLDVPLVLLVDESSASASELVSGALQDQGKATIIGEVTFGKGTVQIWQGLSNGGGLRVTTARWITPNGDWIHKLGITPDIEIDWDPEGGYLLDLEDAESIAGDVQLQGALQFLQEGEVSAALTETTPEGTQAATEIVNPVIATEPAADLIAE